uniref:Uncharacterized protein n=1 Tax=Bombyx mori TaxID=7091 RepID=A0A8R2R356_BOMMO|nr:uncharacterized protein LOC101739142 isoform X2 [Bombyx mori]
MARCDQDSLFYRVLCVSLLLLTLTFVVILTNVFVDIDGLVVRKKENERISSIVQDYDDTKSISTTTSPVEDIDYNMYDDIDRTKRSLETENLRFQIRNPKIKDVITRRLAALLNELDPEDVTERTKERVNETEAIETIRENQRKERVEIQNKFEFDKENMLHLAVHNVLLNGFLKHKDLNEVFQEIRDVMSKMARVGVYERDGTKSRNPNDNFNVSPVQDISRYEEKELLNEMMNCKDLKKDVSDQLEFDGRRKTEKDPKMLIKTVIDITSLGNNKLKNHSDANSRENIKGSVKMIYNGKSVRFINSDSNNDSKERTTANPINEHLRLREFDVKSKDVNMARLLNEYLEERLRNKDDKITLNNNRRSKRSIRIRYTDNSKSKPSNHSSMDDSNNDLYVEIETDLNSNDVKGKRKRKLIKDLIKRIQMAIHSNSIDSDDNEKKKSKHLNVKKRVQNPLVHKNKVTRSKPDPKKAVHRKLDPLNKAIPNNEESPYIHDRSGESWKNKYTGPRFLTGSKAINSAELNEVEIDYNKVLNFNGIPQRLQKPLTTGSSAEFVGSFFDVGKLKFIIQELDGSGLAVGFNQYVDEAPDPETMKVFTGMESMLESYHESEGDPQEKNDEGHLEEEVKDHAIQRRSVKSKTLKSDHHSNEYKVIFEPNFLQFNTYHDVYNQGNREVKETKQKPRLLDESIFERNLNPAQIFGLSRLFDRRKRSVNVKKISNLKNKVKLSRFLNTRSNKKKIYINKKRNKRDVSKIRVIAGDPFASSRYSDENIFVVSDENLFADRALIRDSERRNNDQLIQEHYDLLTPLAYEASSNPYVKLFEGISRQNALMSKYPHIFLEDNNKSKERKDIIVNPFINKFFSRRSDRESDATTKPVHNVNLNTQDTDKQNYKVSVKIMPKNATDLNPGFKEIHTSINKSFHKNGLLFSSLVNVTEISKVIAINNTKNNSFEDQHSVQNDASRSSFKGVKEEGTKDDFIDLTLPFDSRKTMRVRKDEFAKLMAASLVKLQEEKSLVTSEATTTVTSTTQAIKISNAPKKGNSDFLTGEIIKKIDRNTGLLQTFLEKVLDKFENLPKVLRTDVNPRRYELEEFQRAPELFTRELPKIEVTNNSHVLPFVYAYQQPYFASNKAQNNVANVLYHGHIHTNTINGRQTVFCNGREVNAKNTGNNSVKRQINQTKFFIDDLENDGMKYKVSEQKTTKFPILLNATNVS